MKNKSSILLFAKERPYLSEVVNLIKKNFENVYIFIGDVSDPFPEEAFEIKPDYCISYISPWIIPPKVLANTKKYALNFHPGPPEYRGIGCTNFAVYNGEKTYGITVHFMEEKVDSGDIVLVKRFPVFSSDTVYSLTQRCYVYLYTAFIEILDTIINDIEIKPCGEKWSKKLYTRKELNELRRITIDMDESEILKRIKATCFPNMPGPYIDINGLKINIKCPQEE